MQPQQRPIGNIRHCTWRVLVIIRIPQRSLCQATWATYLPTRPVVSHQSVHVTSPCILRTEATLCVQENLQVFPRFKTTVTWIRTIALARSVSTAQCRATCPSRFPQVASQRISTCPVDNGLATESTSPRICSARITASCRVRTTFEWIKRVEVLFPFYTLSYNFYYIDFCCVSNPEDNINLFKDVGEGLWLLSFCAHILWLTSLNTEAYFIFFCTFR